MKLIRYFVVGFAALLSCGTLHAQETIQLRVRIDRLERRLSALENENSRLKSELAELRRSLPAAPAAPGLAVASPSPSDVTRCINHMKNIGLAFRIFAVDHNDEFPFHVPEVQGGSKESVSLDANGFDRNPARHFMTVSNELVAARLVVCPADTSRRPAASFSTLQNTNITYLLRTGPDVKESNPEAVLAKCPIHNHVVRCDGSVEPPADPLLTARNSENACINNLRQIDGAKEQWALENRKPRGAVADEGPTGVIAYIKGFARPVCPSGGIYTFGPVGTRPTCSVPEHKL